MVLSTAVGTTGHRDIRVVAIIMIAFTLMKEAIKVALDLLLLNGCFLDWLLSRLLC